MRLITTTSLKQGMQLSKPVYNDKGQVLISEGVPLTERIIRRLKEIGVTYVYIKDKFTDGIKTRNPISPQTRARAMDSIENAFEVVSKEKELSKAFVFNKMGQRFSTLIRDILDELKNNEEAISLLSEVYSYDNYIFTHSLNVTIYTLALGVELKLSQKQLEELGLGAMLHDVGKMLVPKEVLLKPARLNDQEYTIIKQHAEDGFNILRKVPNIPLLAAHCAYQHHERIDGSGYPRGITGDKMHFYSKLIGVTDVYDAVTSNRVYRSAMLPHEGLEILYAGTGTQFELEMVEAFRRAIAVYPIGLTVITNDGRKGIVIDQNEGLSDRPIIRILEENDKTLEASYELDLSKELKVVIVETVTTLIGKEEQKSSN